MMHNIPPIILAMIVIGYLVIAFQFWNAARGSEDSEGKKAMFLLLGIFILCSLAGYAPRFMNMSAQVELAVHIALVLATWWFIFTNQAAHIMKALR